MTSQSLSKAMQNYRQTKKGKDANKRCSAKYYRANKDMILAKQKERVICPFCDGEYNSQYFKRKHLTCCPCLT